MSRRKRAAVHALLAAFTLWPLAHLALVRAADLNPWKLAGWGMYAAPQMPAELRIDCLTPDEVGVYPLRTLPPGLQEVADRFLRLRRGLRRLVRPSELARALLDEHPAIDGVRIHVVQPTLDWRTGLVEDRTITYEYRRSPHAP